MAHRRPKPHYTINLLVSLIGLGLFSLAGVRAANTSSAATANPYGSADYCTLENNTTVIYGWAADPDATFLSGPSVVLNVGQYSSTVATNQAGYRDDAINSWIDANRRGDPKPGSYGFRLAIPQLYKGNSYPISGTILNVGNGSNTILSINNSAPVDGDSTKSFFAGNVIPDACLAPPGSQLPVASVIPPVTANHTNSDVTGSSVMAGTMAADVQIDSTGSSSVRIIYGSDPLNLNQSSSETPVNGSTTTISLKGLSAATSYSYRVVRTDGSGKKTTSPLSNFDTLGFVVALHFVDNQDSGIEGISAQITGQKDSKTSDDTGTVQFTNVAAGNYGVTYKYLHKDYVETFMVSASSLTPTEVAAPQVLTLDQSINIQTATPIASVTTKRSGTGTTVTLVAIIVCILGAAGFLVWQNLKRKREIDDMMNAPPPPLPEYRPLDPQHPPIVPVPAGADHMGKSLKELVAKDFRK